MTHPQFSGRRKAGGLAVAVGVVAILMMGRSPLEEPNLLRRAQLVATRQQWQSGGQYGWLSNRELLFQRSWISSDLPQSGFFRYDVDTKTATHDDKLTDALKSGYSMRVSPDGKWLLSGIMSRYDARQKKEQSFYAVIRIADGTPVRRFVEDGFITTAWCGDSRHWMEFSGRHVAPPGTVPPVNMNAQPVSVQRVGIGCIDAPERMQMTDIAPNSLLRKPGLTSAWNYSPGRIAVLDPNRLLIWERQPYPSRSIVVQEIGLQSATPAHSYVLTPPGKRGIVHVEFTAKGDRVGLKLAEHFEDNGLFSYLRALLHLPISSPGASRQSLWVSRVDGSDMREVGAAPDQRIPMSGSGPIDEDGEHLRGPSSPRQLRWLPDGKHLSFSYKDDLYTITAD